MLIDGHAHIYEYLKPYNRHGDGRAVGKGQIRWPNGRCEQFFPPEMGEFGIAPEVLLDLLSEYRVDHAILLQSFNYGPQNDFLLECSQRYPQKFTSAVLLDIACISQLEVLKNLYRRYRCKILKLDAGNDWGLSGLHQHFHLTSESVLPWWEFLNNSGMTVVCDPGFGEKSFQLIGELLEIKKAFPALQLVLAHALFPQYQDCRRDWEKFAALGTYFDLSNILDLSRSDCFAVSAQTVRDLCNIAGADHLIWGSDFPSVLLHSQYQELLDYIPASGLFSVAELEWIFGLSAVSAYRIEVKK